MNSTRKLVLTAILCGLALATSSILSIPLGIVRAFPIQHLINVLLVVLVGTKYSLAGAFSVSLLRNFLGLGTLFAFPGSMVGALLSGLIYQKTKSILGAAIGELIGTGVFGALLCYPIARFVMGREVGLFFILPAFFTSALIGSLASFILLKLLMPRLSFLKKELRV